MNTKEQEIDLSAEHGWQLSKIRVGKKVLSLQAKGFGPLHSERVSFQKKSSDYFGEYIEIRGETTKQESPTIEKKVCSLGHEHDVRVRKPKEYISASVSVPWEYVTALIEWLETGNWAQVRKKKIEDQSNVDG